MWKLWMKWIEIPQNFTWSLNRFRNTEKYQTWPRFNIHSSFLESDCYRLFLINVWARKFEQQNGTIFRTITVYFYKTRILKIIFSLLLFSANLSSSFELEWISWKKFEWLTTISPKIVLFRTKFGRKISSKMVDEKTSMKQTSLVSSLPKIS